MLKRILTYLLLAVLAAYLINWVYESTLNPGSLFFSKCIEQTHKWNQLLRTSPKPCYVFSGGSEVRMCIEPKTMLEKHSIRAVNAGVQVGNGVRCNAQSALPFVKEVTLCLSVTYQGTITFRTMVYLRVALISVAQRKDFLPL